MKKWMLSIFALALMLPFAGGAQALPVNDLTALARYYPADTAALLLIRSDPAFFDTLDQVVGQVNANLGGMLPPELTARGLLDQVSLDATGQPYEIAFGSWLGDTVSLGILSFEGLMQNDDPAVLLAAEVRNRAALTLFLAGAAGREPEIAAEGDNYTVFEVDFEVYALVSDDTLLISNNLEALVAAFSGDLVSLADAEEFTSLTAMLPYDNYNVIAYSGGLDLADFGLTPDMMAGMGLDMGMMGGAMMEQPAALAAFTITENRNFIIDAVAATPAEMMGMGMMMETAPVDLEFARYLPGNTQLLIQGTGFGSSILASFEALDAAGPMLMGLIDQMAMMDPQMMEDVPPELLSLVESFNLGGATLTLITPMFAGFTGLNLERDVLDWMTGDYAVFLNLIAVDSPLSFSLDTGMVVEVTEPGAGLNIVETLTRAAALYDVQHHVEEIGAGQALVVEPIQPLLEMLLDGFPREILDETRELDILVGADENVFVIGSRPSAQFALEGSDGSLFDTPEFQYAMDNLFVPDTLTVWYVATRGMVEALPALGVLTDNPDDLEALALLLSQLESATITGSVDPSGATSGLGRLTLTLARPAEVGGN